MKTSPPLLFRKIYIGALLAALILPSLAFSQSREELEGELKKIEAEILAYEKELATTKTQKNTLTNKINQLKKEQQKITLQIKSTSLQINKLGKELSVTEGSIKEAEAKLRDSKAKTTEIIRAIYEQNQRSMVEVFAASEDLSGFLRELEALEKLTQKLAAIIAEVKVVKSDLEGKHANLEVKHGEQKNLLSLQTLQQKSLTTKTGEQNKLLKDTQGKESQYQKILADSRKRASEIRNRIYEVLGVSKQITFGEAVEIARWASGRTGVRAEFLLAVLTQESDLGKNVGTCNRIGDPATKSWKAVMKPGRDQAPFLEITKELGFDPAITPVSCPMKDAKGNRIGWGGAMGPAQFIPSTWVLYDDRVMAITGKLANPWDVRDAFLAAALLLKDNGASGSRSDAEWRAAMLYFSGSVNTRFRFYGDNVVATAKRYEEDIKTIG